MNLALPGRVEAVPNTEGGQTAHGRWDPPTNFGHLIGDLLGMRNLTPSRLARPHGARPECLGQVEVWMAAEGARIDLESLLSRPEGLQAPGGRTRVALESFGRERFCLLDVDCSVMKNRAPSFGELSYLRAAGSAAAPYVEGVRLWPPSKRPLLTASRLRMSSAPAVSL